MVGSIDAQTSRLLLEVKRFGTSRITAQYQAMDNGAVTTHEIGKEVGIHSQATADFYRDTWRSIARMVKDDYGINDLEKITSEHVVAFLESKITRNVAKTTFLQYASAIEKLEVALNSYANFIGSRIKYNFYLKKVRDTAHITLQLTANAKLKKKRLSEYTIKMREKAKIKKDAKVAKEKTNKMAEKVKIAAEIAEEKAAEKKQLKFEKAEKKKAMDHYLKLKESGFFDNKKRKVK